MFNRLVAQAEKDGEPGLPAGLRFAEDVLSILLPFLCVFTTLIMVFPKPVVWLITLRLQGGRRPGQVRCSRPSSPGSPSPICALISLVSLMGGIMNSLNRFWVNAAAPVLLNICMIAGLLFFRGHSDVETARTQAIAVTVSGVAQLAWLVWSARQAGVVLRLKRAVADARGQALPARCSAPRSSARARCRSTC